MKIIWICRPSLVKRMIFFLCNPRLWHHILSLLPAGEGEGRRHHVRTEGHQEEARCWQQAGRTHPLGEEDPRWGSLVFRCQVSLSLQNPFPFFILHDEALLQLSEKTVWRLLVFDEITVEGASRLHLLSGVEWQGILRCLLQKCSYLLWNIVAAAFLCLLWDYVDPISPYAAEQRY